MSFTLPPLRLQVGSLRGVKRWRQAHPTGRLLPADVRRDAFYQRMARHNRWLRMVIMGLLAMNLVLAAVVRTLGDAPVRMPPTAAAAPPVQSDPTGADAAESPVSAVASVVSASTPLPVPAPVAAASQRVPAIALVPAPAPAPRAVTPRQPPAQGSSPPREDPPRPADDVAITDFFGVNTAVMLSLHGGTLVRTYRVGDALPEGEVITSIDTNRGSITTNRRTIRNKDH